MCPKCRIGDEIIEMPDKEGIIMTKYDCEKEGGTYMPDHPTTGVGNCFVRDVLTRSLGATILNLGATFKIATDFRDQILKPNRRGQYFLERYYSNLNETWEIANENYMLIASFIETWIGIQPWVKGILEANGKGDWKGKKDYAGNVRFNDNVKEKIIKLLEDFKKGSKNSAYRMLIEEAEKELELYSGLTPYEALELLRRGNK